LDIPRSKISHFTGQARLKGKGPRPKVTRQVLAPFVEGNIAIRRTVSKGIKDTKTRTGRIENMSASFPVRGVIIPLGDIRLY